MKYRFLYLLQVFIFTQASSQNLVNSDIRSLYAAFTTYFIENEDLKKISPSVKSEYAECFIQFDSSGKVVSFGILTDCKRKSEAINLLKKMSTKQFMKSNCSSFSGKTLMIPLLLLGQVNDDIYVDAMTKLYPLKRISVNKTVGSLILLDAFYFRLPSIEVDLHPE